MRSRPVPIGVCRPRTSAYIVAMAQTVIRPLPHPATAARLILETVVWFSRHRHRTPDSAMITDQAALETTVDFLVGGLVAPTGQGKSRTRRTKKTIGARGPHPLARSR